MDLLKKVVERIQRSSISRREYFIEIVRNAADIEGVQSVFKRMLKSDDEQLLDHLMEIQYGLLFNWIDFEVRFEPTGNKGPDLLVARDGVVAFVEVKRYRPKAGEEIPDYDGAGETIPPYGDPAYAQERIARDLLEKLRQIAPRNGIAHGILALWSDRDYFEDIEFECAVRQISSEPAGKGLQFCVFGSDWIGRSQRYFCEPVIPLSQPFNGWIEDIHGVV